MLSTQLLPVKDLSIAVIMIYIYFLNVFKTITIRMKEQHIFSSHQQQSVPLSNVPVPGLIPTEDFSTVLDPCMKNTNDAAASISTPRSHILVFFDAWAKHSPTPSTWATGQRLKFTLCIWPYTPEGMVGGQRRGGKGWGGGGGGQEQKGFSCGM